MQSSSAEHFVHKLTTEKCLLEVNKILESLREILKKWPDEFHQSVNEKNAQALFCCIANAGVVKDFPGDEFRDYDVADFNCIPEVSELSFSCLNLLCQRCISSDFPPPRPATLVAIFMLCGTHHQHFLWTKDASVQGSQELCLIICKLLNKQDTRDVLRHRWDNGSVLVKDILQNLKRSLNKQMWRRNPCNRHIFKWILLQLKHFEIPDLLPHLLPPALLFVDDHTSDNKLLGIQCLHHIIKNVPPTVLKWQGRSDVVYDALRHLTYTHEPKVIEAVHPCLLNLLAGMEPDPNLTSRELQASKYDELFSYLLSCMLLEQKIKLRNAFAMQLPHYMNKMGITVLSHSKKLFEVFDEYLSTYDSPSECSRLNVLLAVQILIKTGWPRMHSCCEKLLKCLLRLYFDMALNPPEITNAVKEEVILRTNDCLVLLNKACPNEFKALASEVLKSEGVADPVVEVLRGVMSTQSTDDDVEQSVNKNNL